MRGRARIADDNALLERPGGRRWLDPQILAEASAETAEGPERVRLPARPVQGHHQLLGESLAGGVLASQRFQLADQFGCEPPTEIGLEPELDGLQAQLVEPSNLGLGEGLIGDVGVGTAVPERQCLADDKRCRSRVRIEQTPAFGHQLIELPGVKLRRSDLQLVTGCPGEQHRPLRPLLTIWLERSPQVRDVNPEGVLMTGRRVLSPQLVDDPVGGDHLVGVDQQQGEQRPLLEEPSGTFEPSLRTSSGPRTENSTPAHLQAACSLDAASSHQ